MSGEELDANHPYRESSQLEQNSELGIKSPKLFPKQTQTEAIREF